MAEYRQWREENRTKLKDVVPLETPFSIMVETSSLCNAKCEFCAHSLDDAGGVWQGNMSMDIFERICIDIKEFPDPVKLLDMYGFGEPLCNPNLPQMIQIAHREKMAKSLNFTSNGLLFTPEITDQIMDAGGVDIIRISIQGLSAEDYWNICKVKMNFEAFLENLRYLYEHKGKCQIRMKIADIALDKYDNGKKRFEDLFGKVADSLFVERILPLYGDIDYDVIDTSIAYKVLGGRENIPTQSIHKVCNRPFYRMRVAANGLVTAACCDQPHDVVYGDISKDSLYQIWNGSKHKSFLKMQLEGRRFSHPSCKNCVVPNDITTEADILDPYADEILERF